MLVMSKQLGVIKHALSLVAILSEKSPFLDKISNSKKRKQNDSDNDDEGDDNYNDNEDKNLELWFHPDGDAMARLRALGAYIFTCNNSKKKQKNGKDNTDIIRRFCTIHNMHQATLERSFQIRQQIASLCPKLFNDINIDNNNSNEYEISSLPPTKEEEISLRQVLTSGII
jgi:HrpA-like RNA helicase